LSCSSSSDGNSDGGDSESSKSTSSSDEDGHPNQSSIQPREKTKQRMSAKQAMEQMQVIQSESQRMAREANINVPYHKARSLSLKEFLNRKTNIKHTDATHVHKTVAAQIKMTKEELKNYA
jgi:hydroxyacyl-ACP dehydratase HTD2-like protein with hotdog domain